MITPIHHITCIIPFPLKKGKEREISLFKWWSHLKRRQWSTRIAATPKGMYSLCLSSNISMLHWYPQQLRLKDYTKVNYSVLGSLILLVSHIVALLLPVYLRRKLDSSYVGPFYYYVLMCFDEISTLAAPL